MVHLCERMSHMYGHKWTSTYGESAVDEEGNLTDAMQTWASGLSGITGPQMADGMRACLDRADTWPPGIPEFRQLCGGHTDALNEYGLDYVPEYYRKPIQRADRLLDSDQDKERRAEGSKKIAEIKNLLR